MTDIANSNLSISDDTMLGDTMMGDTMSGDIISAAILLKNEKQLTQSYVMCIKIKHLHR